MGTFSLVSQALRTAEPLPQAFNQNLLDRLQYHGRASYGPIGPDHPVREAAHKTHLESITELEYVYYASAVAAVYQVLDVSSTSFVLIRIVGWLNCIMFLGPQRMSRDCHSAVRGGSAPRLGSMEERLRQSICRDTTLIHPLHR
jgi:hypothetical protein